MATELGKAYVQIVPSAKGISGAIGDQLNPEAIAAGESAGSKMSLGIKATLMAGAAAIGAAATKAIGASITEGAALQQSLGGVETLFKKSAGKVKKYADVAYKTAGMSANSYMENVTSLLQSLGGNTGKAAKVANMAMIDMSDNANKFGSNMGDIQNAYQGFAKQNYTMLDNLKLGYGGTKTEMQRLLKDAQKLTGVKYDINNLSDVYKAIHAIQKNLDITGTTAKEAASTFSGSFDSMKAAAQNLLGKLALGQDIQPSLEALGETTYNFFVNNFLPMIGNILKGIPTLIGGFFKNIKLPKLDIGASVKTAFAVLGAFTVPVGLKMLGGIFSKLSFVVKPLAGIFSGFTGALKPITGIFSGLAGVIKGVASGFSTFATSILKIGTGVGVATAGLAALALAITQLASTGAAGVTAMTAFGLTVGGLTAVFALAAPALQSGVLGIAAFGAALLSAGVGIGIATTGISLMVASFALLNQSFVQLTTVSSQLLPMFTNLGLGLSTMMTSFLTSVITNIPLVIQAFVTLGSGILTAINTLMPQLINTGMNMIMSILNGINANIGQIISVSVQIITKFIGGLANGLPQILAKGVEFIVNLFNGIAQNLPKIVTAAVNVITAFIGSIGNNLGRIVESAINLITKFAEAIIDNQSKMATAATKIIQAFVTSVGTAMGVILGSGTKLIGWFIDGLLKGITKSRNAGKKNANAVKDGTKIDLFSVGQNIISGLVKGINSMIGAVQSAISRIANKVTTGVKKALKIHSPSRVMAELGGYTGQGFVNGIEGMIPAAGRVADDLASKANVGISNGFNDSLNFTADDISKVSNVKFDDINAKNDSTIVSQLNEVMSLLNNLNNKNQNYQVVLDNNVLAGELTPNIDRNLSDTWRKNDGKIGR